MIEMMYNSTRGQDLHKTSAQAIQQGLAADGGLFMPAELPSFTEDEIRSLCSRPYEERAALILSRFLTDYTYDELLDDCRIAYGADRFPGGAAPVVTYNSNISVLELWHGPTCAFKDMALQIMPRLLSRALRKTGEQRTAYILVATSGDTGKAALEGYRDIPGIRIMVFYPADGVSRVQKLQMATQEGVNVSVHSVVGNFDDTQNGVKRIFADRKIAETLSEKGYFLSSANSINWGRLAPQIVYYFSAYCDMVNAGTISFGEKINVCVPTGNFGNIFAGYIAKQCGLPVKRFLCASNCNNVLTDFFHTGIYDRNRTFVETMSPSMDILISSNLERLLYLAAGSKQTTAFMESLKQTGRYDIGADLKERLAQDFTGMFCDEAMTAATIKSSYEKDGYLHDTHTAVALHCARRYLAETGDTTKMLTVSTASPYKFASSVYAALTGTRDENEFRNIELLSTLTGTPVPAPIALLAGKSVRFRPEDTIYPGEMADAMFAAIEK